MSPRRSRLKLIVPCVVALFGSAFLLVPPASAVGSTVFYETSWSAPPGSWADDRVYGNWLARYNGYGTTEVVLVNGNRQLRMSPLASTRSSETHAGLVTTRPAFGDLDLTVKMRTVRQLRQSNPNPWEAAWLLWDYQDDEHFYSVVLKPNGWELGKEDPAYPGAQRYLRTGSSPRFPIGPSYRVRVRQVGATIKVWVDGQLLTTFTDRQRPYRSGAVGLYTEDATVLFDQVRVRLP